MGISEPSVLSLDGEGGVLALASGAEGRLLPCS